MKNKLWIIMALILVVATATTAFAAPKKKHQHPPISQQIADSIHQTSRAILQLKVRRMHTPHPPPNTFRAKPQQN
ncbi:MAG TPA: hypothetical protein VMZ01_05120 [Aestuariivirga sp.]|nr:hypothetical protein [Aestuariivirga sp.]